MCIRDSPRVVVRGAGPTPSRSARRPTAPRRAASRRASRPGAACTSPPASSGHPAGGAAP
eukprot:3703355-Alexandrium_andersonii.AAC.1